MHKLRLHLVGHYYKLDFRSHVPLIDRNMNFGSIVKFIALISKLNQFLLQAANPVKQLFMPNSFLPNRVRHLEDNPMEEVLKTTFEMQERIVSKLRAAGADSQEKAVSAQEADFDVPEQNWLNYIAGGLFALVKKTQDKRYYVTVF
jgi:hypothetical protein